MLTRTLHADNVLAGTIKGVPGRGILPVDPVIIGDAFGLYRHRGRPVAKIPDGLPVFGDKKRTIKVTGSPALISRVG